MAASDWPTRLRALLEHEGCSARQLSRRLGFSHTAVSAILGGRGATKRGPNRIIREAIETHERRISAMGPFRLHVTLRDRGDYVDCVATRLFGTDHPVAIGYGVGRTVELALSTALFALRRA